MKPLVKNENKRLNTKLVLFLLILLGFFQLSYSQSLTPIFKSNHKKVDELCQKAHQQMLKDEDNLHAIKTADQAKQIAISDQDDLAIAKANATLSWIFLDNNNLNVAENFVNKAFQNIQGKKFPEAEGVLNHQIGIILDKKSEPKKALEHYLKAVNYYIKSKNHPKQIQVYIEISRLYLVTGDKESFNKYFKITEELLQKYPNPRLQLNYNNQKGFLLMGKKKFPEAYEINMKSVEIASKNDYKDLVASSYYNAAGALFELGKTDKALQLVDYTIDYSIKNKLNYTEYLVGKASILMSLGKNNEAEQLYLNSIKSLQKSKNKFMEMQARNLLSNYYKSINKKDLAAEQFMMAKQIEDSIASVKQSIALKEVEYQYKDQEKEELLQSYKTSSKLKNWLIILGGLLTLGTLYLFFNLKKNSNLRQILFEKKEKLLESEKLNAIREKELAQKEEEKAILNQKFLKEEQQRLQLEKENTDRELASITLYVQEKNKMLEELQEKMKEVLNDSSNENRDKLLNISKNIKQSINFEKDWDKIKLHFEKVHPDFFSKLSQICPQLTQNELKHCAYIKINMNNKETATLLGVDYNTVKMSRYRIKKKLELQQEEDLTQFIQQI